ncbi:5-formyltetrahydrofolate cyclo-ligase isoform X1 [Electrophorus electricus]|uniref:5-formyltetrahydrofolate cyclo-ligase n=2 Tax=Electrophorus TaxID=8004 RepID=A0AAY5EIB2_ELEEL|nr:5-formyltetrahydrofolate cyclo-ligase isoform X1 [Electrophorus electricus]
MATLRAAKQALRKEVKKRLASLSEEEKLRQSQIVSQKLFQHPRYKSSRRVAVFLSMADEVCTDAVVRAVLGSGKACFIPRYLAGGNHMDMLRLKSLEDLASLPITSWNIRQPADSDTEREEALSTGGLDLILMPGLAFNKAGNRLGRGRGFYDTYLQRCMTHPGGRPYTIALAFKEQLCEEVPTDDGDMLVDEVLHEDE